MLVRALTYWHCCRSQLLARLPCVLSLISMLTSLQNFNSSRFLLELILPNVPWTIFLYFRLGIMQNNLPTRKIMVDVLLTPLIHSLMGLLQTSASKVPSDSAEQEEMCGIVWEELGVYEGDMKSNNNV